MLWRLLHETVEVPATATLHRPGCGYLTNAVEVVAHPAGVELRRDATIADDELALALDATGGDADSQRALPRRKD